MLNSSQGLNRQEVNKRRVGRNIVSDDPLLCLDVYTAARVYTAWTNKRLSVLRRIWPRVRIDYKTPKDE